MKNIVLILIAILVGFALAASAGTISGQVSGVAGQSVVYVDTISGKTFPAPTAASRDRPERFGLPATRHGGPGWNHGGFPQ